MFKPGSSTKFMRTFTKAGVEYEVGFDVLSPRRDVLKALERIQFELLKKTGGVAGDDIPIDLLIETQERMEELLPPAKLATCLTGWYEIGDAEGKPLPFTHEAFLEVVDSDPIIYVLALDCVQSGIATRKAEERGN